MNCILVKVVSRQEYADSLLHGNLYAKRLSCFRKMESDGERGDEFEGASVLNRDGLTIRLTPTVVDTGMVEQEVIIREFEHGRPPVMRLRYFDHMNVFCMYATDRGFSGKIQDGRIHNYRRQIKLPQQYIKFGKYAVVITNTAEFLKRVENAVKGNKYNGFGGHVTYYDPEIGTTLDPLGIRTVFAKRKRYAYQKEFRIAIDTGTMGDEPITLNVGEMKDIAMLMDTVDLIV